MCEALLENHKERQREPLIAPEHPSYKWWVTWTIMIGAFLFALDSTIVNIAVPQIMVSLSVDINTIQWVLIIYLIAMGVVMPAVGWLSDILGHKNLYALSLGFFTLSSGLCGMAWSAESLIFFRLLQGLGAGAIAPTAMAIIFQVFPPKERGLAMGIYSLGWTFGPILGPTVGGYLTDYLSWRAIFYINLPFGILGVLLTLSILSSDLNIRRPRGFDFFGLVTMSICVVSLLTALSQGQLEGWDSGYILSLFTTAGVSFLLFLLIEYKVSDPLLDLTLYKNPVYIGTTCVGVLLGLGLFSSMFLVPLFVQDMLEYTAFQTGLLMLPGAVVTGIVLPIAGRLSDRINPRILVSIGFLSSAFSLCLFSRMNFQTEAAEIVLALLIRAGMGFIFPPLLNLSLRTFTREKISAASGMLNITRQIAGMCGIAISGVLLERWHHFTQAYFAGEMGFFPARTSDTLTSLRILLRQEGEIGSMLHLKTMGVLQRALNQEAFLVAFQDSFFLLVLIFSVAALCTFLIPPEDKRLP